MGFRAPSEFVATAEEPLAPVSLCRSGPVPVFVQIPSIPGPQSPQAAAESDIAPCQGRVQGNSSSCIRIETAAQFAVQGIFVAKRKHIPRPEWSRAIRGLMASSRYLRTQTALARKSGVTQSTIGRILRGEVTPQSGNLERLAKAFGMSYSTLAAIAEGDEPGNASAEDRLPRRTPRLVPLLSLAQAARSAESVFPNYACDATDWIERPKKPQGSRTIALRISGESMEPDCAGQQQPAPEFLPAHPLKSPPPPKYATRNATSSLAPAPIRFSFSFKRC